MQKMDYEILNQCKNEIEKEYENYKLTTYSIFTNSAITKSNNEFIKEIVIKLDNAYQDINHSYETIINYLDNYLKDLYSLESYLSGTGKLGSIGELELRNFVDFKLSNLK